MNYQRRFPWEKPKTNYRKFFKALLKAMLGSAIFFAIIALFGCFEYNDGPPSFKEIIFVWASYSLFLTPFAYEDK